MNADFNRFHAESFSFITSHPPLVDGRTSKSVSSHKIEKVKRLRFKPALDSIGKQLDPHSIYSEEIKQNLQQKHIKITPRPKHCLGGELIRRILPPFTTLDPIEEVSNEIDLPHFYDNFESIAHSTEPSDKNRANREKWRQSIHKVKGIVAGMAEMKKNFGVEGKIVEPHFFTEVLEENHHFPGKKNHNVTYLSNPAERSDFKIEFRSGEMLRKGVPFHTEEEKSLASGTGWAIFVIDPKGVFYAGTQMLHHFHHTSFLGGAAIMGGGEIKTDQNGKIVALSNKSGHYQPSRTQSLNTLKMLHQHGVDLSKVEFKEYSGKQPPLVYQSALEYLHLYGNDQELPSQRLQ
ncbi:MAG: hypothetical protein ACH350_03270 [Parachlamydiaceae bacterium]